MLNENKAETPVTEENRTETENISPKNIVDLLLGADTGKMALPEAEIEIKRLSDLFGEPCIAKIKAIGASKWEEIQDLSLTIQGKDMDIDMNRLQILTLIEGVRTQDGKKLFKDKALLDHFNAATPADLVKKILIPGEIIKIYDQISEISGFNEDSVVAVKN